MSEAPAEEEFVTDMVEGFAECASYEYLANAFETMLRMDFLDLSNGKSAVLVQHSAVVVFSECAQAPTE